MTDNISYPKRKSLRLKHFDYSKPFCYSITICANGKKKIFIDESLNYELINCLRGEKQRVGFKIYAYCLMPSHLHLLLNPSLNQISVSRFIGGLKSKTTKICWGFGLKGKIWQGRFYDHILRKEEDLKLVGEYILNNPVRAGLATNYQDYKFCGLLDEIE